MEAPAIVETPAIGNRGYTNDVRLRGRRRYSEIKNHWVESSTRVGGFCLCRRGFNHRVIKNRRVDSWNLQKQDQKRIPSQESLIFDCGEQPDF